jgi:hypothetical protein
MAARVTQLLLVRVEMAVSNRLPSQQLTEVPHHSILLLRAAALSVMIFPPCKEALLERRKVTLPGHPQQITRPTIPVAAAQAQAGQALLPGQVPVMAVLVRFPLSPDRLLGMPVVVREVGAALEAIQPQQAEQAVAVMPVLRAATILVLTGQRTQAVVAAAQTILPLTRGVATAVQVL